MRQIEDCRRMHCRGEVKKQQTLEGDTTYVCQSCGAEYTETGVRK